MNELKLALRVDDLDNVATIFAEGVTDGENGILIGEDADSMAVALMRICDGDSEAGEKRLSRRLGDAAMHELYVSWEDRIDVAVARYREVIEMKNRGELEPRRAKLDRAITALSEIQNGLDKVRDFFTGTGQIF